MRDENSMPPIDKTSLTVALADMERALVVLDKCGFLVSAAHLSRVIELIRDEL